MNRRRVVPTNRTNKYRRLRSLQCFEEVVDRLRQGFSTIAVAKYIQQEQEESTDVTEYSLATMLKEYRNDMPPNELLERQGLSRYTEKAMEKVKKGLDVLETLQELIELQRSRIGLDYEIEKKAKKSFSSNRAEISTMGDLLKNYSEIEASLGLKPKNLGEVSVNMSTSVIPSHYSPNVAKVIENPVKRQQMLNLAKKFIKLNEKSVVEEAVIVNDDDEIPAHLLGDDMPGAIED